MGTDIICQFLKEINEFQDWVELKLEVEFQLGMLGFKGWSILEDSTIKSLRAKPTDEVKIYIKQLHSVVAINPESKWNKLEFILYPDNTYKRSLVWDSKWQREVDSENLKHKQRNPNYQLPRWKWDNYTD